ncbi:gld-3 [Pristionchus pacificus]|uniref:Defective in germ line development protein 3-like KH5 domain-containing protein n=1 Tax=Pristionchus pacificus TaxID=54126 RepID=A0A8R1V2G7_PRIPA|nr:gld-3 [Pristionchus pacificus]
MQNGGGEWRNDHRGNYYSHRGDPRRLEHYTVDQQDTNFFHDGQQSIIMQEEQQKRTKLLYDQKRRSTIDQCQRKGSYLPRLPMVTLDHMRVTLCIEVSGHHQLLASPSVSTGMAALLRESNTLIRLPEKDPTVLQYVNQVTITGKMHEVEHVRQRIREMTTISVTLPLQKSNMNLSCAREWLECAQKDGTLPFPSLIFSLQRTTPMLVVVGAVSEEGAIICAVNVLLSKLYKPEDVQDAQVLTVIDFPSAYRDILVGKPEGTVLVAISKETRATIHFPLGHPYSTRQKHLAVMCSGKVEAILAARRMILDLLPAQLCLDIENFTLQDPISNVDVRSKHYFVRENNLTIRMEKSELEPEIRLPSEPYRHFVAICTSEYNIQQMYDLGGRFLNMAPPIIPHCPLFNDDIVSRLSRSVGPIYASSRVHSREIRFREEMMSQPVHHQLFSSPYTPHTLIHPISTISPHTVVSHPIQPSTFIPPTLQSPLHPPFLTVNTSLREEEIEKVYSPSICTPSTTPSIMTSSISNSSINLSHGSIFSTTGGDQSLDDSLNISRSSNTTINMYNLPPPPHAHSDGMESGEERKGLLEGRRTPRDMKKHTLELKPKGERGEKTKKNGDDTDGDRDELPLKDRSERNDSKTSYAQVLQQKATGRMDPLKLIELAGEESAVREIVTTPTTYASVARSNTTSKEDDNLIPPSSSTQQSLLPTSSQLSHLALLSLP